MEFLHDSGIAIVWPGLEPVAAQDCLDLNLLESASMQPFQAGFGQEFYPTIYDKAACLFFSLAGGHIFSNGNKRTAVLAVDQFFMANGVYLTLSNEEMRKVAISTASYNERGENQQDVKANLARTFQEHSFPFSALRTRNPKMYRRLHEIKTKIRVNGMNSSNAKTRQTT